MKETTLTIIRYTCFIIGIGSGFTSIYLQETEYADIIIISVLAIIMACGVIFFALSFMFIDTDKSQKFGDVIRQ